MGSRPLSAAVPAGLRPTAAAAAAAAAAATAHAAPPEPQAAPLLPPSCGLCFEASVLAGRVVFAGNGSGAIDVTCSALQYFAQYYHALTECWPSGFLGEIIARAGDATLPATRRRCSVLIAESHAPILAPTLALLLSAARRTCEIVVVKRGAPLVAADLRNNITRPPEGLHISPHCGDCQRAVLTGFFAPDDAALARSAGGSVPHARGSCRSIVFIDRARTEDRAIANSTALVEGLSGVARSFGLTLQRHDFNVSFERAVAMFADACVAVGVHGAGLAHAIFMRNGSAVIELTTLAQPGSSLLWRTNELTLTSKVSHTLRWNTYFVDVDALVPPLPLAPKEGFDWDHAIKARGFTIGLADAQNIASLAHAALTSLATLSGG